jgi:hypothetical protein
MALTEGYLKVIRRYQHNWNAGAGGGGRRRSAGPVGIATTIDQLVALVASRARPLPEVTPEFRVEMRRYIESLVREVDKPHVWDTLVAGMCRCEAGEYAVMSEVADLARRITDGKDPDKRASWLMGRLRSQCRQLGIVWPFREGKRKDVATGRRTGETRDAGVEA